MVSRLVERIAIARAIVSDPAVLLLDEAVRIFFVIAVINPLLSKLTYLFT